MDGAPPVRVPDGLYEATVTEIRSVNRFKRHGLDFTFRLATDPYNGWLLPGYVALKQNGKPAPGSKLTRWWLLIADYEQVARRDRIALRRFQHYLFRIRVGRSVTDWNHQAVPEAQQRSIVQDIVLIVGRVNSASPHALSSSHSIPSQRSAAHPTQRSGGV